MFLVKFGKMGRRTNEDTNRKVDASSKITF